MTALRVPWSALPDELRWFFEGQFAVAEALGKGWPLVREPYLVAGNIVVMQPFETVAAAPDVYEMVSAMLAATAARRGR